MTNNRYLEALKRLLRAETYFRSRAGAKKRLCSPGAARIERGAAPESGESGSGASGKRVQLAACTATCFSVGAACSGTAMSTVRMPLW